MENIKHFTKKEEKSRLLEELSNELHTERTAPNKTSQGPNEIHSSWDDLHGIPLFQHILY